MRALATGSKKLNGSKIKNTKEGMEEIHVTLLSILRHKGGRQIGEGETTVPGIAEKRPRLRATQISSTDGRDSKMRDR